MSWMRFFRRNQWDQERARELEAHLQIETDNNVALGMPADEARAAACRKLGNPALVREEIYRMNSPQFLESFWNDLRYGWRMLRKNPGFTAAAVITLALGIGANTAVFSLVDWLLFQQLPVSEPRALTYLAFGLTGPRHNDNQFSFNEYQEIRKQAGEEFDGLSAFAFGSSFGGQTGPDGLTWQGKTLPLQTFFVTGNFFSTLGLNPEVGRFFTANEGNTAGADPVMVLAWDYWQSRFHGDREIIGQSVAVNGHPFTIIGIAPRGFFGPAPILHMQAYLPLGMLTIDAGTPENFLAAPDARPLLVIGRLNHNSSSEKVDPALALVGSRLLSQTARPDEKVTALHALPLRPPGIFGVDRAPLQRFAFLFVALGALVLALACVNVANLLLVRATTRQGEMALRAALGAARGRLVRQLLTESLLLAALGCLGGIAIGALATRALASLRFPTDLAINLDLQFNWLVFVQAFSVALISGVVVGVMPALRMSRANLNSALHDTGRSGTERRQRMRNIMVAAQVAGSMVLLIVAGLFARSLQGVQHADPGFDPRNVMNMTLGANQIGYSQSQAESFYQRLLERVRALPGVESASLAALVPMGDTEFGGPIDIPGNEPVKGRPRPSALYNAVSPHYFTTLRIPLLSGRDFADTDTGNQSHVAIVNEVMADRYWHGQDAIGRRFFDGAEPKHPIQIVGIMKNSRTVDPYSPIEPTYFVPLAQHYFPNQTLQIRTSGPQPDLTHEVLAQVELLAPSMPVSGIQTMTEALNSLNGLFGFRLVALSTGMIGFLGMALAVIGVYGVMSYAVSRRTHEIGIRMALGAQRGQILSIVGMQGLMVVAAGLALGLLIASAIGHLAADFLINTSPTDAMTYIGVSLVLALAAMVACYIPARRATRVDPVVALRNE